MGKLNQTDKSLNTLRVSTLSPNNNLNSTTMRRTRALKNTAARGGKMLKMDDNVYAMRRKVMDELYNIKRRGYRIPRIEVRIVSENTDACAYAYLGQNIIHFNKKYINVKRFTQVVLHEIVHATFGIGEVVGCRLMHCTEFWLNDCSESEAWELFDKYYGKHHLDLIKNS